jgi:hypothetical protein
MSSHEEELMFARPPMTSQETYRTRPQNATPTLRRWSLASLAWFQGAALILLGRLLCMAWVISAAVSATRRLARGTWSRPVRRLSAVLQQERDEHLRPALVLRVRRGEGDREVPLFDDPAVNLLGLIVVAVLIAYFYLLTSAVPSIAIRSPV